MRCRRLLRGAAGTLLGVVLALLAVNAALCAATKTIDLAAGMQDVIVFGEEQGDGLAISQAATGDFNGDGFMDLLVGANHADGPTDSRPDAGEAYVFFGGAGLPSVLDVAGQQGRRPDVRIYGQDGVHTGTFSPLLGWWIPADSMGEMVTTGDLNDDGFDDLVVTAALADGPGNRRPDSGEVYVIFGRSQEDWEGLRPTGADPVVFDVAGVVGSRPDVIIYAADEADVLIGASTGDVNGDGTDDLLLGAAYGDGWGDRSPDAGDTYVLFGRPAAMWSATIDLRSMFADVTFYGRASGDHLRWAASAGGNPCRTGDVDADGVDDVILVASHADYESGEAYVYFGRAEWPREIRIGDPSAFPAPPPDQSPDVTFEGASSGDQLGYYLGVGVVVTGDVDGDGTDDLLIGAPNAAGLRGSGTVYLVAGRPAQAWPAPIAGTGTLAIEAAAMTAIHGADPGDWFGTSIAVGDIDSDGIVDVIVGAPGGDGSANARPEAGEVVILLGRRHWPSSIDCAAFAPDAIVYGEEAGDGLGTYTVTTGDVDGDQAMDLAMGAYGADGPLNSRPDAGQGYVIYGPILP
jgi:hypothetical protein